MRKVSTEIRKRNAPKIEDEKTLPRGSRDVAGGLTACSLTLERANQGNIPAPECSFLADSFSDSLLPLFASGLVGFPEGKPASVALSL